ncbi:heme A synthase [Massilia sp. TS11]|uniref:COX15/CtaA family protein n=1 Tax=Massilia sp. TS11 TaxID=2908003 RepID=UPI001EDAE350|nr:COX15/CtaA family protein [Massilia sp. TS11]MCG2585355.1 COX15/CtaA family protein [Massilia sp. TS11]
MSATTLFLLSLTALLIASLPLLHVLRSPDSNKFRKLVRVTIFLTFDLIVFGAYTRLTDSGLGCPDWPGCFSHANPFLAQEHIDAAEAMLPSGPVTTFKAWIEMIHRALASGVGVLTIVILVWSILKYRKTRFAEHSPWLPLGIFLLVCLQGAFGAWTVTFKLQPIIVTTHLMLGMTFLASLVWLGARQEANLGNSNAGHSLAQLRSARLLALATAAVVALQVFLGGWVATNYATLACTEYPLCAGRLVPEMDFEHGYTLWRELGKTAAGHYIPFAALTAIHWVHRNMAWIVALLVGLTAWRAWPQAALRPTVRAMLALVLAQFVTGIATIYFKSPLAIAALHNAGAAGLVLLASVLNYKAKYQCDLAQSHRQP